ncbi:HU family DNA-binding protein [Parabacteroides sp.]
MNKNDLVRMLSSRLSLTQKDSILYLNTLLDIVSEELSEGNNIVLQGFGAFSRWEQTERIGRNPRTGVACPIHSRNSVKFKPGKFLLDRLNGE